MYQCDLWGPLRRSLLQLASVATGKSSQEPDLRKHILHLSAIHPGETKQEAGKQEDRQRQCQSILPGTAPTLQATEAAWPTQRD